eukprot:GHUV01010226.1.p1 GENE.GHUV01010226.1~~GHUV01010226.1.p1  ORF type:complete len:255 (+),score=84.77 GHUV01010226.1:293-1057(+)
MMLSSSLLGQFRSKAQFCPRTSSQHPCRAQLNYYEVLEIDVEASQQDIKAAFRRKAKLLHPDVNPAADAADSFRAVKRAHEVLSSDALRQEHDIKLNLPSAQAKDPRFARFYRWRGEVIPDLEIALAAWTAQVSDITDAATTTLLDLEQQMQVLGADDGVEDIGGSSGTRSQAAAAVVSSMQGVLQDAIANIQRQYDKRYEQVQVRYPAYPDIVWYDVWLEVSDGWLAASAQLAREWTPKIQAAASTTPTSEST